MTLIITAMLLAKPGHNFTRSFTGI